MDSTGKTELSLRTFCRKRAAPEELNTGNRAVSEGNPRKEGHPIFPHSGGVAPGRLLSYFSFPISQLSEILSPDMCHSFRSEERAPYLSTGSLRSPAVTDIQLLSELLFPVGFICFQYSFWIFRKM